MPFLVTSVASYSAVDSAWLSDAGAGVAVGSGVAATVTVRIKTLSVPLLAAWMQ